MPCPAVAVPDARRVAGDALHVAARHDGGRRLAGNVGATTRVAIVMLHEEPLRLRVVIHLGAHEGEDAAQALTVESNGEASAVECTPEYALGNREVHIQALAASREMYSRDGLFVAGAADTAYQVLKLFDASVANATIDLSKTLVPRFIDKAQ